MCPNLAVWPEAAAEVCSGGVIERCYPVFSEVVEVEMLDRLGDPGEQQGLAIVRPIIGHDIAGEMSQLKVCPLAAAWIPEQRSLDTTTVGRGQHTTVSRQGREHGRLDAAPLAVPELGDALAAHDIHRDQTVFGLACPLRRRHDGESAIVRNDRSFNKARAMEEAARVPGLADGLRIDRVGRESILFRHGHADQIAGLAFREAERRVGRQVRREILGRASLERHPHEVADLVALLVVEVIDRAAIGRHDPEGHT